MPVNRWGFSLIEVLVSAALLSIATLGITSTWKLADDKALAARLDERAARILVEFSELQNFAPAYLLGRPRNSPRTDFESQDLPLSPGETRTGFLYHPRHLEGSSQKSASQSFDDAVPYQVKLTADSQGDLITLTYQLPYLSNSNIRVTKQTRLNPRQ
jgi:prepilin-type N-terminal cleavage/methylation domain-containing protein